MKARPVELPRARDFLHRLAESRTLKLMALGVASPEDERRWARAAGLPVAELRARAAALRASRSGRQP